ncbi:MULTISPECIES: hypothetical protein [unclassified Sphingobacterium]|uniref:hypothetical protein n=1 Tax=unclassified Sphingobacterium TaxID=2609468 RepID=UPI0025EF69B5|nr:MULTISPECIES: hypothetical protein [unclassified Sphingobacterium]
MEVPDFEIAGKNGIVSKSFNNLKIETFAPTLSEYDAMALAKGGVVSDMSSVVKSANYNHREGKAGTRCTTK